MRLIKLTTFYPQFLDQHYRRHPELARATFQAQKVLLDHQSFGWADFWSAALGPLGYEVMEVTLNAEQQQRAWARENLPSNQQASSLDEIALAQIRSFKPDIVWFEAHHAPLLKHLSSGRSSIRLLVGWSGSAIPSMEGFELYDLILSCAPESVAALRERGYKVEHIHHAFDPRINERLRAGAMHHDLTFVGQLIRQSDFHLYRERLLEELVDRCDLHIFSSSADISTIHSLKTVLRFAAYGVNRAGRVIGIPHTALQKVPGLRMMHRYDKKPVWPVSSKLRRHLHKALFGLDMYRTLAESRVTLNIHADSSPTYASNMRLFETTGVGSCLLTDWKSNLAELFKPDQEVIVYRTPTECAEKARWLLDHSNARQRIAGAGQKRTLRDHTFAARAPQFDHIIRAALAGGGSR